MDGLSQSHAPIKFGWVLRRTFLLTEAAACAFLPIDIGGFSSDSYPKISGLSLNTVHLRIGKKSDTGRLTRLDRFGSQGALGTIEGGKGFGKLKHSASDGGKLLHKDDFIPPISQVNRRRDPGDSSTNHHCLFYETIMRDTRIRFLNLIQRSAQNPTPSSCLFLAPSPSPSPAKGEGNSYAKLT